MEQYLLGLARLQEKEANKIPAVISVNKCDLDPNDRKSSMADVKEFAEKYGIKDIYETSAKENTNVTEVFTRVLELILTNVVLDPELIGKLENGESILKQNAKKKAKKKKCIVM
jgi:GTPase SAR1 family protein